MSKRTATQPAVSAQRLATIAEAVGVALPSLPRDERAPETESRRVPASENYALWEAMIAHGVFEAMTVDDARALRQKVSARFPNVVRLLARASTDLRAAFEVVERYWPLVTTAYGACAVENGRTLCLRFELVPERLGARAELWFVLAAMVDYAQTWPETPVEVSLALRDRELPVPHASLERLLGAPIALDAGCDELRVVTPTGNAPFRHADEGLVQLLEAHARRLLEELGEDPSRSSAKVLLWIERAIKDGLVVFAEDCATALGLSARTLRRALQEDGTTFVALRERVRERLALAWLDTLSDARLAARLGYSDATAFRRAFRRWTDKTPAQVRSGR